MWGIQAAGNKSRKGIEKHWAKLQMPRACLWLQREMQIHRKTATGLFIHTGFANIWWHYVSRPETIIYRRSLARSSANNNNLPLMHQPRAPETDEASQPRTTGVPTGNIFPELQCVWVMTAGDHLTTIKLMTVSISTRTLLNWIVFPNNCC